MLRMDGRVVQSQGGRTKTGRAGCDDALRTSIRLSTTQPPSLDADKIDSDGQRGKFEEEALRVKFLPAAGRQPAPHHNPLLFHSVTPSLSPPSPTLLTHHHV